MIIVDITSAFKIFHNDSLPISSFVNYLSKRFISIIKIDPITIGMNVINTSLGCHFKLGTDI